MGKKIFRVTKGLRLDEEKDKRLIDFLGKRKETFTNVMKKALYEYMDRVEAIEVKLTDDESNFANCLLKFLRDSKGEEKREYLTPIYPKHFELQRILDWIEKEIVEYLHEYPERIPGIKEVAQRCKKDNEYWKSLYSKIRLEDIKYCEDMKKELKEWREEQRRKRKSV